MAKLGVNIDHVATIRQARGGSDPDPVVAALICEFSGCHSIVAHLREDRRHIQQRDVSLLRDLVTTRLNLEMSIAEEIVKIALKLKPNQVTLVPEKRKELTTEGGLDVVSNKNRLKETIKRFKDAGISVSLFIEPCKKTIEASKGLGASYIELHTGAYANSVSPKKRFDELNSIIEAAAHAKSIGLGVNAGHGLNYDNVTAISQINEIEELNIGHSIIAKAVFTGLSRAVKDMIDLIRKAQ